MSFVFLVVGVGSREVYAVFSSLDGAELFVRGHKGFIIRKMEVKDH